MSSSLQFVYVPYDYTVEVRNRFKGLDLIDRVPDELWNEIRDIESLSYLKNMMQVFKATFKEKLQKYCYSLQTV